MYSKSFNEKIFSSLNYIILGLFALSALYPFMYTLSLSLSTQAEAIRAGFHFYPREVSWISYEMVLKNENILIGYGNTLFRTIMGTILTLVVTSMFAYPLSKNYLPNKKFYTFLILFTMLFSGGLIPSYLLIKSLHLMNNRWVYILPTLISAFNVIILKNFFQSIPESLNESAKIDGANEFIILFRIIIPLSKPVLATLALWTAVGYWNAWFDGMLYITDNSKQILQILLQRIVKENQAELIQQGLVNPNSLQFTPETIKSATIIITMLPILCVYPFIQKYFVKGIMLGSIKEWGFVINITNQKNEHLPKMSRAAI